MNAALMSETVLFGTKALVANGTDDVFVRHAGLDGPTQKAVVAGVV